MNLILNCFQTRKDYKYNCKTNTNTNTNTNISADNNNNKLINSNKWLNGFTNKNESTYRNN